MNKIFYRKKFVIGSILFFCAQITFILVTSYSVFVLNDQIIFQENELIENTQVLLLVVSFLVFLTASILEQKPKKLFFLFSSLICYAFVIREIDVEKILNAPEILKVLMHGSGRTITLGAGFLTIFYFVLCDIQSCQKMAIKLIKDTSAKLLLLAGAFLFLGDFFEKINMIPHHVYFEEISEFIGYSIMLWAACRFAIDSFCNFKAAQAKRS